MDDVPELTKTARLNEIIELQTRLSLESKENDVGHSYEVLVEGLSKKSDAHLYGRTSQNKVAVFPKGNLQAGDYASIRILSCTSATLLGEQNRDSAPLK
jgi:tRNA-2-methylthio-N6-dimethylallyladenosine synthase